MTLGEWIHAFVEFKRENAGQYEEAARHALLSPGEEWRRHQNAARHWVKAGRHTDALRHFQEAQRLCPCPHEWNDYAKGEVIKCHEACGQYDEAFRLAFETSDWMQLFYRYRDYARHPGFSSPPDLLRRLFLGLCSRDLSYSRFFNSESRVDQELVIEGMARLGLHKEAIDALRPYAGHASWSWQDEKIAQLHCELGEFETAARLYETFCMIDKALECYRCAGRLDMVSLALLADGKADESAPLVSRQSPQSQWMLRALSFTIEGFQHPLRALPEITPSEREMAFGAVRDVFETEREAQLTHRSWDAPDWIANVLDRNGSIRWACCDSRIALPEVEALYRLGGHAEKASLVSTAIQALSSRTGYPPRTRWWVEDDEPLYPLRPYIMSGQFFRAILLGEMALRVGCWGDASPSEIREDLSRAYELLGAFDEAVAVKTSQLQLESDRARDLYQDIARLQLKNGLFVDAARTIVQSLPSPKTDSGFWEFDRGTVVAARLFAIHGQPQESKAALGRFIEASRRAGRLPAAASQLEAHGFLEEAIDLYREIRRSAMK